MVCLIYNMTPAVLSEKTEIKKRLLYLEKTLYRANRMMHMQ